jgi:hypothetical protein
VTRQQGDARSFGFASAQSLRGSWSASQSGASSVGPSEHVGGKGAALSVADGPAQRQGARRPSHTAALGRDIGYEVPKAALEQESDLGGGRRSGTKPSRRIGRALRWPWKDRKDAGTPNDRLEEPALHREAERDTTGS